MADCPVLCHKLCPLPKKKLVAFWKKINEYGCIHTRKFDLYHWNSNFLSAAYYFSEQSQRYKDKQTTMTFTVGSPSLLSPSKQSTKDPLKTTSLNLHCILSSFFHHIFF